MTPFTPPPDEELTLGVSPPLVVGTLALTVVVGARVLGRVDTDRLCRAWPGRGRSMLAGVVDAGGEAFLTEVADVEGAMEDRGRVRGRML